MLSEEYLAIVHKDMLKKLTDPSSFNIPCYIGDLVFNKPLADLGESINLRPSYLFEKLDLGTLTPTKMCIRLADRSIKYSKGVAEDVLVRNG